MKRFYKLTSTKRTDEGWVIQLDGKTAKTPSGQDLAAPSKALAEAILAEWGAQGDQVIPDTMPLTQILITAIDKMRQRETLTKALVKYLDTDLICYRTKEPEALLKRQKETWDPWLTWFDEHFESPLEVTFTLNALKQDPDTHKRIWNYIEALDEYYFAVLEIVTSLSGSIVLSLAFLESEASPDQVFSAMYVEEDFKSDLYHEDLHGKAPNEEKKQISARRELKACRAFLDLVDNI
ncbi:MAG: ATP12 chaperone family protein [Alphaproteobacteria bacterium]|nr:ATP12 chaperone family protein [Alphaproteobacteria bacterium]